MKKVILIAAGVGIGFAAVAQKSQIRTANNYIGEQNYEKAKAAIEIAVNDESTKDDPNAWFTRGNVYLALQQAQPDKEYYNEAGKSYKKAVSLESDFRKEEINPKLFAIAIYNFNAALGAFDKQGYDQAFKNFGEVVSIRNIEGGKRFSGKAWAKFDTIAHQANLYQAYSAYYSNKYDDALPLLLAAKNDPITKNANIYLMLADIYQEKKDNVNLMTTLGEAKKEYPGDKTIVNRELNYFIKSGKTEELITKLEDAVTSDPGNAEFLFTLGVAYDNMANPKDKDNKDLPKPANYAELFTKAEQTYQNAIKAGDKAEYNYNMGALYFNRAVLVNEEMNAITGTTTAELKKYDGLKLQRDEWFTKALPYLEKTVTALEPNAAALSREDKNTYRDALTAAKEIYAKQNKLDKATEFKKKLEAIK